MTLTSDGGPCVSVFRDHSALAARREKSRKRLTDVGAAFEKCSTIKKSGLAVFCAGSLARMEAGDKSDLDLFVTADGDGKSHGHLLIRSKNSRSCARKRRSTALRLDWIC